MPGASNGPYMDAHQFQFDADLRAFQSRRHFNGTAEQTQRAFLGSNVINTQRVLNSGITYQLDKRSNIQMVVPIMQGWFLGGQTFKVGNENVALARGGGPTDTNYAGGIGDITLAYNRWMRDPVKHPNGNFMLGLGFSLPTGNNSAAVNVLSGNAIVTKPADTSIQTGTGALGYIFQMQGYQTLNKRMALYYSGSYLATTGTTTGFRGGNNPLLAFNSAFDQYSGSLGVAFMMPKSPGLVFTFGGHYEAVPATNLLTQAVGFRRPGYTVSVEPGVNYTYHNDTWSLSIPVTVMRDRVDTVTDGVDVAGDATIADWVLNFGFRHRFGKGLTDFKTVEPKTSLLLPPTHADYSALDDLGRADSPEAGQFVTSSELVQQEQKAESTSSESTPQGIVLPSTDPQAENAIQQSMVQGPVSVNN